MEQKKTEMIEKVLTNEKNSEILEDLNITEDMLKQCTFGGSSSEDELDLVICDYLNSINTSDCSGQIKLELINRFVQDQNKTIQCIHIDGSIVYHIMVNYDNESLNDEDKDKDKDEDKDEDKEKLIELFVSLKSVENKIIQEIFMCTPSLKNIESEAELIEQFIPSSEDS